MASYEHKLKNAYLGSPYNEWTPLIPWDYTLLRWPCDEGFHVPLQEEWQAIVDLGISQTNIIEKLHLPIPWCINYNWTKTSGYAYYVCCGNTGVWTWVPYFTTTSVVLNWNQAVGYNIRAFRNTPIIPDETRTETLTWKIRYNADLWLISILVWTNQYITMQDKNMWATTVFNRWDTTSEAKCGKFYQRWNDYWFPFTWPTNTSSTQVDASWYWPNNHYSSDTFITWSYNRSSVQNDNLRWYTDFNS